MCWKKYWPVIVLLNVYLVGVLGFLFQDLQEMWANMTALNLLFSFAFLYAFQEDKGKYFTASLLLIGALGYFLELAGVKTGLIFGSYSYGTSLGWKVWDTPLMIAVNWIMLVIMAAHMARRMTSNIFYAAVLGAGLMTGLDLLIEPFAMAFDLWSWEGGRVPLQNYVTWFIASFIFNTVYMKINKPSSNVVATPLFIIMALFFLVVDVFVIW